jgi:polar amino acid transport system substrate-binding protein
MAMHFKILPGLAALALFATVALTPGIRSANAADALELLVPGELTAATEGTYPPFSMEGPDGKLDGLEMRVMGEIAKRLGLTYKPVITKWETILIGLKADQYDTSSDAMDITEERQKQVVFIDGWIESGGRLLVKTDSPVKSSTDIKGKTVGVLVASTWEKLATGLGATVKSYKSETDAIQDLLNGNVDGVVTDSIAGAYLIKSKNLPIRMTDGYLSHIQKGFPVKPGKPNLVKAINKALADMIADGTYAKMTSDIIGYSPAPTTPIPSKQF